MSDTNYNLQLIINNQPIAYVPNSLEYDSGEGESDQRAGSTGGRNVEMRYSENAETFVGEVMFDLFPDATTETLIKSWKAGGGDNQILIVNPKTNYTETFLDAALVNKVKRNPTSDGVVSFEFKASPAV